MDWKIGIVVLAAAVLLYGCICSQTVPAPVPPQNNTVQNISNNTPAGDIRDGAGLDDQPPPPPPD